MQWKGQITWADLLERWRIAMRSMPQSEKKKILRRILSLKSTVQAVTSADLRERQRWAGLQTSVLQKKPDLPVWMPEEEPDIGWNPKWMTPRAPEPEGIRFLSSGIRIKGSRFPLRDVAAKNILLQRQTSFCFTAETELVIPGLTGGQEAGLVCYYDENTWVCLAVCRENSYYIQVKEHIGDKDVLHERQMLPCDCSGKKISLKVETEYLKRRFTYRLQGEEKHIAAEIANVYYLCDEGIHMGKRFTGAMTGIYAVAGEHKLYADFFNFIYQDIEA